MSEPVENIGALVPSHLADKLRLKAKITDRSVSAELRQAIRTHVADLPDAEPVDGESAA